MSDFLAGQTLTPLHFPPTVSDTENDSFSFDSTTFGVDADSGTYNDCGVAFTACATGRAKVEHQASLDNSGAASTSVAPVVRTGAVVGSGTVIVAASLDNAVINIGTDLRRYGSALLVSGLTPGSIYNVRLEHRASGGTGTVASRHVIVSTAT